MEVSATENERLAVRTPPAEKGAFHAFEYLISADDASATTLTFVHSGYLGDDWEGEFDFGEMIGFGWDMYLHTLAQYLTHLDSSPAHFVTAQGPPTSATPESWAVLEKALGVQGPFGQGQHLRLTPQGLPALEGVVDFAYPPFVNFLAPHDPRPTVSTASTTTRRWVCPRPLATTSTPTSIGRPPSRPGRTGWVGCSPEAGVARGLPR